MTVGVRVVVGAVVGEAVGLRPSVLAVGVARPAADLVVARVLIDIEDVVGVVGILVGQFEDVPGVG